MTAFMLACYLNGSLNGTIYFRNVNDCTYYTKYLSEQTYDSATGENVTYNCICKLVPRIDENKVKVY